MDLEDIEEEIPVHNLQLSQGLTELRVKVVTKNDEGFTETKIIDRLKIIREDPERRPVCVTRPFNRFRPVSNTICLSVEDVKEAKSLPDNCWQTYDCLFRRVLVYGKVVVLNQFTRDNKHCYKFSVDDGSETIIGTMNVTKEAERAVSIQAARLTLERNKLRQMRKVGINISGSFHPPESLEYKSIADNIACLQNVTLRNVRHQKKSFQLGPISEKALILASLYLNSSQDVQLHIFDITLNDSIELAWKRQLNKLYLKEYFKQSKV